MGIALPADYSTGDILTASDMNKILTARTGDIKPIDNTTRNYADLAGAIGTDAVRFATGSIVTPKVDSLLSDDANAPLMKNSSGVETGFFCQAWVNFDGTTQANVTATYVRTGTSVVVTFATTHGYLVGHQIYADFTSGTATDGVFTITAIDAVAKTITFTHGTSGNTSGNITLNRRAIRASGKIHSITYNGTGDYTVNFLTAFSDENYCSTLGGNTQINSSSAYYTSLGIYAHDGSTYLKTTTSLRVVVGGASKEVVDANVAIFR